MVAIPTAPDWSVGEDITDVDLNAMRDYLKFTMETKPFCYLIQQTTQTFASSTTTAVTFGSGSEVIDRGSMHSTSTNNSRVNIGTTLGWYRVSGIYAAPANTATTTTRASIALNGSNLAASQCNAQWASFSGTAAIATGVVMVEATSASDYVELRVMQVAGSGTIGTGIASDIASALCVEYVGKS